MQGFVVSSRFRDVRDAWWAARKEAGARVAADRLEARWKLRGADYLRGHKGLDGQLVRVPAELQAAIESQIEAVVPKLAAAFDRELGRLVFAAWRRWPVDSGLSRSLLEVSYGQEGETFSGRVHSGAPYTVFIKSGGTSAFVELLRKPGREAALRIASGMAEASDGG